jgi:hypothetical protein
VRWTEMSQAPGVEVKVLYRDESTFIWRPEGNRHEAYSPDGCLIPGFFLKPNTFLK